jgi:hypothetical protein
MKKYLIPDAANPEKLAIIGASGFVPQWVVAVLPEELYEEEAEWLIVTDEEGEFGEVVKVVSIDQPLKAQILAERQAAQQAANRLTLRTQKRQFGERLIDEISLLNEQAEVDLESLESMIMDPDLMVIRELLWTGSIKSAYERMLSVQQKVETIFGEANFLEIKSKMEQFLQSIGEL